jgi:hypothetical protein
MDRSEPEKDHGPAISLRQGATNRAEVHGQWLIGWEVLNHAAEPITIVAVRLPHGQFKSAEQHFMPALQLSPGKGARFQTSVRCDEPLGLVTENAFVIFTVDRLAVAWRIFVRIRVVVSLEGVPETTTELITTQKVGFSGVFD